MIGYMHARDLRKPTASEPEGPRVPETPVVIPEVQSFAGKAVFLMSRSRRRASHLYTF